MCSLSLDASRHPGGVVGTLGSHGSVLQTHAAAAPPATPDGAQAAQVVLPQCVPLLRAGARRGRGRGGQVSHIDD